MVFQTLALFARNRGVDALWKKKRIFKLTAHYRNRNRNCYSIAIRFVRRALVYATKGRKLKKEDMAQLWEARVTAAAEEHNLSYSHLREGLARSNILLNRKVLADLAAWEPRTFKALTKVAHNKAAADGLTGVLSNPPPGVITRGML